MTRKRYLFVSFLFILLPLFSAGCSRTVGTDGSGDADGITMKAAFESEDGIPLSNCAVRFSDGENNMDCQSDENGTLTVSGMPGEGVLTVAVLDGQEEPRGTVTLRFSQGAVIDAATDENSVAHVTLKEDTREIALCFTLYDDNTLGCELRLSEGRIV